MDYLQAAGAPIIIKYDGLDLTIPKFDMSDVVELGNKIMHDRVAAQTKDMNDEQRAQFIQYYPPLPPDMVEIKRFVRTPEGMQYVIRKCLTRDGKDGRPMATLPQKEIGPGSGSTRVLTGDEVMRFLKLGPAALGPLAWALADMEEKPLAAPTSSMKDKVPEGNSSTNSGTTT